MKEGKRPYHVKKKELKKLYEKDKIKELKKKNKLGKYLEKKKIKLKKRMKTHKLHSNQHSV